MKPILLILAAGMGSRYGGLKQIDPVGPSGETLMEFGIFDAIRAGFEKAVFLFRDDIVQSFENKYKDLQRFLEVTYAFQDINPEISYLGQPLNYASRIKPWGTGHAILSAAAEIQQPFAVINADDFYGPSAYQNMFSFLSDKERIDTSYAIMGYPIENTMSSFGQVSRALLDFNDEGLLTQVVERTGVSSEEGRIEYATLDESVVVAPGTLVSTNLWGFTPTIFPYLQRQFEAYAQTNLDNNKAEFFIPSAINELVKHQSATVNVLSCEDDWMGITYQQDKSAVAEKIQQMIKKGLYPTRLWP